MRAPDTHASGTSAAACMCFCFFADPFAAALALGLSTFILAETIWSTPALEL